MDISTITAIASAALTAIGLITGWYHWRRTELRREDVLAWANEAITALQSLILVSKLKNPPLDSDTAAKEILRVIFQTSILIESGRLFFKNQVTDNYGSEKPPAYRGYRPKILDPIVLAHQVACAWPQADEQKRLRLRLVAEDCLRDFVSLAQKEVGRGRTASADTSQGGSGVHLPSKLNEVSAARLEKLRY
jgi:hypothetical protein